MNDDKLLDEILEVSGERPDGRRTLACADAFALAEKLGVKLTEISRLCNLKDIRIAKCQLGCFK